MSVKSLQCPSCGGAVSADCTKCQYCGVGLVSRSCPKCFGGAFATSRFCPHCGETLASGIDEGVSILACPRCKQHMHQRSVEGSTLTECHTCGGLWIDADAFRRICADRDKQAIALDRLPPPKPQTPPKTTAYVPCPRCSQLMNRTNFTHRSGVVIDICTPHGIWFDRDELRRIIDFILGGGMDHARKRERELLEQARREADAAQRAAGSQDRPLSAYAGYGDAQLLIACNAAGALIRQMTR